MVGCRCEKKGGGLQVGSRTSSLLCVCSSSSSRESPQEPQPHAGGRDLDSGLGSSANQLLRLALLSELSEQGCQSVGRPACWVASGPKPAGNGKAGRGGLVAGNFSG